MTTALNNDRIFYATQAVAIAPEGTAAASYDAGDIAHGVQSIGITTNFNLEQAFELGQLEIYENIEGLPDVEVTMEKVLDGNRLLYHMASAYDSSDNTSIGPTDTGKLIRRSKIRADVRLGIYEEDNTNVLANAPSTSSTSAGDKQSTEVYMSGMFISSVSYTVPVDGNATESVTFVGNNKKWFHSSTATDFADMALISGNNQPLANLDGNDSPLAATSGSYSNANVLASGGIQRREDVIMTKSIFPKSIRGVSGTSAGNGYNSTSKENRIHVQNFSCSTDFSREDILELGRKTPYARPANFPIEVSCEIEAITTEGDFVTALEEGNPLLDETIASGENTENETIKLVLRGGYVFDLGEKNRLSSVSYGGGDAGGGNATCTYSFTNFNDLDVLHYSDNTHLA
jgi:hypothetical protein